MSDYDVVMRLLTLPVPNKTGHILAFDAFRILQSWLPCYSLLLNPRAWHLLFLHFFVLNGLPGEEAKCTTTRAFASCSAVTISIRVSFFFGLKTTGAEWRIFFLFSF